MAQYFHNGNIISFLSQFGTFNGNTCKHLLSKLGCLPVTWDVLKLDRFLGPNLDIVIHYV